jgi:hypothetical protein
VYIARQLPASGAPHTLVQLCHIPEKPSACPRTAPSAAAEGTVVVAADLAVGASNRTAAAVEDSYTAGSRRAYTMKADSFRVLAAVAVSLVGPGPGHGHEKACSSWPLLIHCIPLSVSISAFDSSFVVVRRPTRLRFMVRLGPSVRFPFADGFVSARLSNTAVYSTIYRGSAVLLVIILFAASADSIVLGLNHKTTGGTSATGSYRRVAEQCDWSRRDGNCGTTSQTNDYSMEPTKLPMRALSWCNSSCLHLHLFIKNINKES